MASCPRTRRAYVPAAATACVAAALAAAGCGREDQPLVLIATCDTGGWIVPCGCSSGQSGGMPRRGAFVAQAKQEADVVVVDIGGAPAGASRYDRIKVEAILRGEAAMGLAAHNLGAAEAALGADYLRGLADKSNTPWVSCNVRDDAGDLIAPPIRIVEGGGKRVALLGVLSPSLAPGNVQVDDPKPAILATLKQYGGEYDIAIALAYLPEQELRELARGVPELDCVLGGPTGQSLQAERLGPTLLASVTNKGKFAAKVSFTEGTPECSLVELGEQYGDDPTQVAVLQAYYDRLESADIPANETALLGSRVLPWPAEHQVAGSQACRGCHTQDCSEWDKTSHAHAWQTLASKGTHVDPYCQQCHTTGYGAPGGFVSLSRSANRRDVGCESCHGPSLRHAENPRIATMFQAKGRCVDCHDLENSPAFDYEPYWKRIVHGYPANAPESPPDNAQAEPLHRTAGEG